jgi:ketosteroid isomerase-like protein
MSVQWVVRDYCRGFDAQVDPDVLFDLLADDVEYERPSGPLHGSKAVREHFAAGRRDGGPMTLLVLRRRRCRWGGWWDAPRS